MRSVIARIKSFWARAQERRQYWRTVPASALLWLALAASLAFASTGLASDLDTSLRWPFWWVLTKTAFFSIVWAAGITAGIRNRRGLLAFLPAYVLLLFVLARVESNLPVDKMLLAPGFEYIRRRLAIDGTLLSLASTMGWVLLVLFAGTQGVRHVRERTELELAETLQHTLAPPLAVCNAEYEIHGRSLPSSQMGGDLLDTVHDGQALVCYVGDVAGHGIQAGVFMGMIKSSARTALLRPGPLAELFASLNRVLFELKAGSATYVTFACLRCREGGKVEYALAGHGPVLHYHAGSKTVSRLEMEQFPLGMFANATFASGVAEVAPGDILALSTDGLPEVIDDRDEQFGLERIGEIVARDAGGELADLTETLFAAVRRYGRQNDDETLVLVRAQPRLSSGV